MSFEIPLLFNTESVLNLNNEYLKIRNEDRYRGLINPDVMSKADNVRNYKMSIDVSGIDNQYLITEGITQEKSYAKLTEDEAYMQINSEVNTDVPLNNLEVQYRFYSDVSLDPRLMKKMQEQEQSTGSNIFLEKSQNLIDENKKSVSSVNKEKNLFESQPLQQLVDLIKRRRQRFN